MTKSLFAMLSILVCIDLLPGYLSAYDAESETTQKATTTVIEEIVGTNWQIIKNGLTVFFEDGEYGV